MLILNGLKRDTKIKGNVLRRNGLVPGVVYGKNLDSSISIQLAESDTNSFLKTNSVGSQVQLVIGDESFLTMLKKVDYVPMSTKTQHLDFQVLTSGEKVKVIAHLNFINKDKISPEGFLQEMLHTIEYRALPADIINHVDVDLSTLEIGSDIKVHELPFANNPAIEILTQMDSTIVSLTLAKVYEEVEEEEEDAPIIDTIEESI